MAVQITLDCSTTGVSIASSKGYQVAYLVELTVLGGWLLKPSGLIILNTAEG